MATPDHLTSCHCVNCRRWGGGPFIGLDMAKLTFTSKETLRWYKSSDWAERGFCSKCGSSLFYRLIDSPEKIGVSSGAFTDLPEKLPVTMEFFIDSKPDYYAFEGERKRMTGEEVFAMFAQTEVPS
jgi:hypothetical protein